MKEIGRVDLFFVKGDRKNHQQLAHLKRDRYWIEILISFGKCCLPGLLLLPIFFFNSE